jgi:hypothetical protein
VWEYRTDTSKNRLYIAVGGFLSKTDTPAVIRGVVQAMNLLKPGFSIISDLSDLPENDAQRVFLSETFQEAAQQFGASRVIHVRHRPNSEGPPKSWPCVSFEGSEARSIKDAERLLGDHIDTI